MPFLDHLGPGPDDYEATPKQDVRLTQLGASATRTAFKCGDAFAWVDTHPGVPDPDSRVPRDVRTDLASIPPFLWGLIASYGRHTMPAILHDVRCDAVNAIALQPRGKAYAAYLRRRADQQFRQTLKAHANQGLVTRYIMWCAVRLFGFLPLALAVLVGVLISLLHFSGGIFLAVSDLLNHVTIWPWMQWLEFVPQAIAWVLGRLAEALAPPRRYIIMMTVIGAVVLAAVLYRCIERKSASAEAVFSIPALLSLTGAIIVGVLSAPPLLPLVFVTVVTRLVLWILDFLAHWLELVWTNSMKVLDGITPASINVPERAKSPAEAPPFPGLFPTP